jgi:CBS domain-containing protein/RNA polymerase-binding transcription factor DksA
MDLEVKSYMSGKPVSIEPDAPALAALDLMIDHAIRHLPVVEAGRRICGVISFDDLRAALPIPVSLKAPPTTEGRQSALDVSVGEVMTYSPITIRYDASLEEAVSKMLEGRFGCLPVVDNAGLLDGIITETDLLHALATVLWSTSDHELPPEPQHDDLETLLEKEKTYLVNELRDFEHLEQERTSVGRENTLDQGEVGKNVEEGMITEQLADIAARRLHGIERALERAARGELDLCERCGERIPENRLRALPGTTICIRCGREAERIR